MTIFGHSLSISTLMSLLLPNAFAHSYSVENCSPVNMSAATLHRLLLDHVVGRVGQLSGRSVKAVIIGTDAKWHLCASFFKIDCLICPPVRFLLLCDALLLFTVCNGKITRWAFLFTLDLLRCQGLELSFF